MKAITCALGLLALLQAPISAPKTVSVSDPNIAFSPYNWYKSGSEYAQTPNPGAYVKVGFTGSKISVNLDVSLLTAKNIPASQYPVVRYSVDNGPAVTTQLTPTTTALSCATGLSAGSHSLLLQYVSGFVFLDFWTPVNAIRVTGFSLDDNANIVPIPKLPTNALFLGDSITNGDDDIATFSGGITNAVDTQDATLGYPAVVAAGIGAEYGIVAYGGASWDNRAADGHTPGLMTSYSMIDSVHSRLIDGKLSPIPDDIFINMGENSGPTGDDVPKLLAALRAASSPKTNIFVIIPFSGRSREPLMAGYSVYRKSARKDRTYVLDLGNNPYLPVGRSTMQSVDGQHPLAQLHATLGAQLVQARANALSAGRR